MTANPSPQRGPLLSHALLALVAILGLLLFILACQPSWSPDGQRLLYSYWDAGAKKSAVALFDRKARTSRIIFEWSLEDASDDPFLPGVQWTKDGHSAAIALYLSDDTQLIKLPINGGGHLQAYSLGKMGEGIDLPLPQIGDNLFLISKDKWERVNLVTGEIFSRSDPDEKGMVVYEFAGRIHYLRQLVSAQPTGTQNAPGPSQKAEPSYSYQFGEVDQEELMLRPTLTLSAETLAKNGIKEFTGLVDEEPRSGKMAVTTKSPGRILLIGQDGIERVLDPGLGDKEFALGNPQWSRDGRKLFVSALVSNKDAATAQLVLLEIPLDNTKVRVDPICQGPTEELDDDFPLIQQIALSPDGKMIAISNGHVEKLSSKRRGLYLVDLSRPDRLVAFYPAPLLTAPPRKD